MNPEYEKNNMCYIVGIGYGDPLRFPYLEILNNGYWFTLRDDDSVFLGKIKKFNFKSFKQWVSGCNYENDKQDFCLEILKLKNEKELMRLLFCVNTAAFEEIIMEFYDTVID